MTCRRGGITPHMRGRWRRHRGEPAAVTQLLFVRPEPEPAGEQSAAALFECPPKPGSTVERPSP